MFPIAAALIATGVTSLIAGSVAGAQAVDQIGLEENNRPQVVELRQHSEEPVRNSRAIAEGLARNNTIRTQVAPQAVQANNQRPDGRSVMKDLHAALAA